MCVVLYVCEAFTCTHCGLAPSLGLYVECPCTSHILYLPRTNVQCVSVVLYVLDWSDGNPPSLGRSWGVHFSPIQAYTCRCGPQGEACSVFFPCLSLSLYVVTPCVSVPLKSSSMGLNFQFKAPPGCIEVGMVSSLPGVVRVLGSDPTYRHWVNQLSSYGQRCARYRCWPWLNCVPLVTGMFSILIPSKKDEGAMSSCSHCVTVSFIGVCSQWRALTCVVHLSCENCVDTFLWW